MSGSGDFLHGLSKDHAFYDSMIEKLKIDEIKRSVADDSFVKLEINPESVPEIKVTEMLLGMKIDLKEHQKYGLAWMLHHENLVPPGGVLADEMGLGKTITLISLILAQKNARKIGNERKKCIIKSFENKLNNLSSNPSFIAFSTLVIAPYSVITKWQKQIQNFVESGKLKTYIFYRHKKVSNPHILANHDVVFTTYQTVVNEMKKGNSVLTKIRWERLILNDAHLIKNDRSHSFKDCCKLSAHSHWAVTGTPIHNNLNDLFSLFKFLRVNLSGKERIWKRFTKSSGINPSPEITELIKTHVLRRTKKQIFPKNQKPLIEMKPKKIEIVSVELGKLEKLCYQQMVEKSEKDSKQSKLKLLKLQEACVHMSLAKNSINLDAFKNDAIALNELEKELGKISINEEDTMEANGKKITVESVFPQTFVSSKLKVLCEKLDKVLAVGDKCVVVSEWVRMVEIVKVHLDQRNVSYTAITGNVRYHQRQKRAESFNKKKSGPQVMLLSLKADGNGYSLTTAKHLFFIDLHPNPAWEQQIIGRICRIGQQNNFSVYKLVAKDTIEQEFLAIQVQKTLMAEKALKESMEMPTN